MKKILLLFLLFAGFFASAQTVVDPHTFPQETNPNNSNFEFYSRALGSNKRATFNNVRKNMSPGIVAVGFTPSPSGNTTNFGDFVLDPSDALWYIAYSGDAVQLPYNTPFSAGAGISISGGNVITNTGDLSNTNELQTISIAGQNLTLSNGGGTVTIPAGAIYTAGTGITILSNVVTNTGDLSATNEGILSVSPGTDTTAIINSSTSGSPSITLLVRGGLSIDETGNTIILEGGAGDGVSSVTGTDGNGFDITVVNPTTAPEISIATTVTGITYGSLGELDAVTVGYGLDFTAPTLRVDTSEVATPYDLSLIDRGFVSTSDGTSHTVTLTPGGGSFKLVEGSNITLTTSGTADDGIVTIASTGGGGSGTVEDFIFTDGNGFNGTVSTSTTTPTLELETTVTGLIYGDSGDLLPVTIGSGLSFSAPTLSAVDVSATNEAQTLSVSGTSTGIVSLNAISGTGGGTATFVAAGINSISQLGGTITITGTEVDGAVANEGILGVGAGSGTSSVILSNTTGAAGVTINASTGISITESTSSNGGSITITNSAPDQTVSLTEGGIVDITGTYPNFTITGTEVDGSTTNELQTVSNTSNATSHTVTLSNSGGSVQLVEGTGVGLATTGTALNGVVTVTNTAPDQTVSISGGGITNVTGTYPSFTVTSTEVDGSTTNELQTISVATNTVTLSNSGGSVTIAGAGINTVNTAGSTITVTGAEVDGSTTNELQTVANTSDATTHTVTLSNSGGSIQLAEGAGIGLATTGTTLNGVLTVTNTGDTNAADDITTSTSAGGDLNGTYPSPTVDGLQGVAVSGTAPTTGQVLKYNGSVWIPDTDNTGGGGLAEPAGQVVVGTGSGADSYSEYKYLTTPNDLQLLNTAGANNANLSIRTTDTTGTVTIGESSENSTKYRIYAEGNGTGIMQVENDSRNNTSSVQPWYESRSFYPDPSVAGDNQVFKAGINYGPSGHVDRYQSAWGFAYENNYTTGSLPGITGHGVYEYHGPEVIYSDTIKDDAGTKFATGVTDQTARRMITFEASNERPSLGGAGTFMVDRMNYYDFKTATQRAIHNVGYISGATKGWHFLDTASIIFYKNNLGGLLQYNAANSGFIGLIKADASDRVSLGYTNTTTLYTPTTNFEMPSGMNFKVTGGAGFEFGTTSSYAGSVIFNTADIFNRSSSNPTGFNTVIAPNYNIADVSTGTTIFSLPNDATNPVMIASAASGGRMGIFKNPDGDKVLQVGNSGFSSTSKMFHLENSTGGSTLYRYNATPESAITANPGDLAIINESGSGSLYLKGSGTGTNTGWLNMLTPNAQQQFRVSRTLQAAGGVVYIGLIKESNAGAAMVQVDIVVANGGGSALAKKYLIPKQFATTGSAWRKCLPISDRGPYGSDDFTLEIRNSSTDGTADSLRIRTEAGSTVLGTAEVTLTFSPWIPGQMSFTPLTITSTPATVSSIYVGTPLNVVNGRVGVNKHGPTEALDVTGNVRISGALMPNNAAGTAGQVLTSAGAGAPPTWATAAGGATDLTFTGASTPYTLNSSTGTDVTFAAGANVTLSRSANELTIAASVDGNGIYTGSGTVPSAVTATLTNTITFSGTDNSGGTVPVNINITGSEPEFLRATGNTGSATLAEGDAEYFLKSTEKMGLVSDQLVYLQGDSIQLQTVADVTSFAKVLGQTSSDVVKSIDGTAAGQSLTWNGSGWKAGATSISPSDISGSNQNDYNPTGLSSADIIYVSNDADMYAITGMATGAANREVTYINDGSYPLIFPPEHAGSTAANRFAGFSDVICYPGKAVTWIYDATASRWRLKEYAGEYDFSYGNFVGRNWSAASITAGDWGNLTFYSSGTGAGSTAAAPSSILPYSSVTLSAGTTATGHAGVAYSKTSLPYWGSSMYRKSRAQVLIPTLSTSTERFIVYFRESTAISQGAIGNNQWGFRYSDDVNGGEWQAFTRNNAGAESTLDCNVAVAANTPYNLEMRLNKNGTEAGFFINGAYVGAITANMPTWTAGFCPQATIVKTVGTTARTLSWLTGSTIYMY